MTYEEVLKKIEQAGMLDQFSAYDLETTKINPAFGLSALSYKQDWANATDQAGRDAANAGLEALRKQYGYTGGRDGSKYYAEGLTPQNYQNPYQSAISDTLSKMQNYGSFDYGAPAPTYTNRYQQEIDSLLGKVQNYGPFSYSKEDDPAYAAYAKQYRREGDRATQQALAQAATLTGGQVSSAAMTAASQAGDYYAGQMADATAQLYDDAYNRYLNEYQKLADQLAQTQSVEQAEYNKYLNELSQYNTDRALSYDEWMNQYNMLGSNLGALQGQSQTEYQKILDQINYNTQQQALSQKQASAQQALAQEQINAMLAAGAAPGADLVAQSGYSTEYVQALENYYKQQAQSSVSSKTEWQKMSPDEIYQALYNAGYTDKQPESIEIFLRTQGVSNPAGYANAYVNEQYSSLYKQAHTNTDGWGEGFGTNQTYTPGGQVQASEWEKVKSTVRTYLMNSDFAGATTYIDHISSLNRWTEAQWEEIRAMLDSSGYFNPNS